MYPRSPVLLLLRSFLGLGLVAAISLSASAPAGPATKRPTDEERGKELFNTHCHQCHGMLNHGHGPATSALVHPVPDLAGKVKVNDATIRVVQRGKGAMPGFETTFDRADTKRVLEHMAKLDAKPAGKPKAAAPANAQPAGDPPANEPDENNDNPPTE